SQLGDLHGPRVERAIEGTVEVARDEQIDAGSHDDDSEQDRERRRHDRPQPERQPAHRIRKPEPRTVSISGGSPSFARRYETYWSTTFKLAAAGPPQIRPKASGRVTIRRRLRSSSSSRAASRGVNGRWRPHRAALRAHASNTRSQDA